jgi:pimeloyl-ACP methyl ester carboxylesterase
LRLFLYRSGVPLVLNLRNDPTSAGQRLMRMVFVPPRSGLKFNREVFYALSLVVKHYNASALGARAPSRIRTRPCAARALLKFVRGEPKHVLRSVRVPTLLLAPRHESIFDARKAVRRAERRTPHPRAEILLNVGRAAIYDAADQVNLRIRSYGRLKEFLLTYLKKHATLVKRQAMTLEA